LLRFGWGEGGKSSCRKEKGGGGKGETKKGGLLFLSTQRGGRGSLRRGGRGKCEKKKKKKSRQRVLPVEGAKGCHGEKGGGEGGNVKTGEGWPR